MNSKRIIIIVVVIAIAIAGIYGYKEFNRKNQDLTGIEAAYDVKAVDLIKEFSENDSASTKKYLGKVILVEGMLKKIDKDSDGFTTISVGDTSTMSSVRCAMDSTHFNREEKLAAGAQIKIKGYFTGYDKDDTGLLGSDVKLNRCIVVKN